jgi:signal transduction histidine kinase
LTVSKKYIEMLGGKFKVQSEVEKGTKMSFVIPEVVRKRVEENKEFEFDNRNIVGQA